MYKKNSSNNNEFKNNKFKERSDETKFEKSDDKGSRSERSNYRGKGSNHRRGTNKERSREEGRQSSMGDSVDSSRSGSYINDPSWYIPDLNLRESLAQWSFSQVAGEDLVSVNGDAAKYPSVMKLKLEPSPEPSNVNAKGGFSKYNYKYTGLNAASRNIYNAMSSMTGRTSAYTPDDISILLLGMGEVISMFSFVRTIMHIPYMINLKNKTIPDCLCKAYGIDPVDLRRNIASYRSQYNTLVTQAQNIILPGNIPYFLKCNEIYSHIYADSEADTAQMYIFSPSTTWLLEEKTATTGSKLTTTNVDEGFQTGKSLSVYIDLIADMISRFQESSTYNIVGQDLLHLNSKTNMPLYGYTYLPEFESMQVEYNENALLQIHNLSVNPMYNVVAYDDELGFTPKNDVVGNVTTGTIFYNPAFMSDSDKGNITGFNEGNIWMDSLVATPTADARVDATRYTQWNDKTFHHTASNKNYVQFGTGDHRCVSLEMFSASKNEISNLRAPFVLNNAWTVIPTTYYSGAEYDKLAYYMTFKWAPFAVYHVGDKYEKVDSTHFVGDLNYPTPINVETMKNLNRMAEQFLFTPGKLVDRK